MDMENTNRENIFRVKYNEREIILIGTAHVSKRSADEVKEIIELEKPNTVCIELCESRYENIKNKDKWDNTDIFKIIKNGKALLFLVNIMMASFQKKMAKKFGIEAGAEMIQGIKSAEEVEAEVVLADRDIQTTFSRIWGNIGFFGKVKLLFNAIMGALTDEDISEDELQNLKSGDMLSNMLSELSEAFPQLSEPLLHERDLYLAQKIKESQGDKVVAVLGAAHVPGIMKELEEDNHIDLRKLEEKPNKKGYGKVIGWGISLFIIALIGFTLYSNWDQGLQSIFSWIMWNGTLSAIAACLIFAHPLSILTAFVAAPISSLNPLLAAGWFAGMVEAYKRRPSVKDFESLAEDVTTLKGIVRNRVSKILLVVICVNLGSTLGTFIGGAEVVKNFMQNIF